MAEEVCKWGLVLGLGLGLGLGLVLAIGLERGMRTGGQADRRSVGVQWRESVWYSDCGRRGWKK
jgi:hypothetical protein